MRAHWSQKRALVLTGVGGRSAYPSDVTRHLEEPGSFPDNVDKTSIGAANGTTPASDHYRHAKCEVGQAVEDVN